jgi:general secretion pathway protein D
LSARLLELPENTVKIRRTSSLAVLVASLAGPGVVLALPSLQDAPPAPPATPPAEPAPAPDRQGGLNEPLEVEPVEHGAAATPAAPARSTNGTAQTGGGPAQGRKPVVGDDRPVALQFREQKIDVLIDTISQWTGKSVIPKQTAITPIKITIISDRLMPKGEALNLIFQALRLNGLGVVETEDMILIDNLTEINQLQPAKVLGPDVDVMPLSEIGSIVIKVFRIRNTKASQVYERLQDSLPSYASLQVDNNSNQIILEGDIALAKRVQRMIDLLDVAAYVDVKTETIKLQYQDAQTISSIVTDLFSARAPTGGASTPRPGGQPQQQRGGGRPGQQQGASELVGTSEQLVVTVLPATNSMTIRAEPTIMREIKTLISALDVPSSQSNDKIFRLYDLKFTDPLKVQTVLGSLLESGGGSGARRTGQPANRNANQQGMARLGGGGGGGESGADVAIANIFRIEAYPDSNRLIVVSKTPQNFRWLDDLIEQIDQPLDAGLPRHIPLKYASAIEIAEILNALLAESGTAASITAPATGLSGIDFRNAGGGGTSGAGSSQTTGAATDTGRGGSTPGQIQLPWGNARGAGAGDTSEVSALIGKSRVVPNAGQNSLLILAPQEIQDSLGKIVADLDHPGRQVMISVILAEVQLGDEFAFGVKWGPGVAPANPNNAVVVKGNGTNGEMFEGTKSGIFFPDLDTGVLAFGVDATVVLQALAAKTTVRILQQPRVFTMDNKEAKFFTGQDVPFQSSSLTNQNTGGDVNATFEQIAVGIGLNVRPRITKDRNVAMEIEVLLSNVNNTQTGVGGNPVIDRRQTNTTVTVQNNQTIVLSGIRREQENRVKNSVPLLGDIPGLDWIFSNTSENKTTSELVIFVTPLVVDNPSENDTNFNSGERDRLRELQKPLKEMSLDQVENHRIIDLGEEGAKPAPAGDPLAPIATPRDPAAPPAPARPAPGQAAATTPATPPRP